MPLPGQLSVQINSTVFKRKSCVDGVSDNNSLWDRSVHALIDRRRKQSTQPIDQLSEFLTMICDWYSAFMLLTHDFAEHLLHDTRLEL